MLTFAFVEDLLLGNVWEAQVFLFDQIMDLLGGHGKGTAVLGV